MTRRETIVQGVGINDADYRVVKNITVGHTPEGKQIRKRVWQCPIYACWKDMIYRTSGKNRLVWYEECSVSKEWLRFSKFREWALPKFYEGLVLDKDILVKGNTLYSGDTCEFVPIYLNNLFRVQRKSQKLPLGVNLRHGKSSKRVYRACASVGGVHKHIGNFGDPVLAHWAWLEYKAGILEDALKRYSEEDYCRTNVQEAVEARIEGIRDSLRNKEVVHSI